MIKEEIKNIKSGKREIIIFAIVIAALLFIIGFILKKQSSDYSMLFFIAAILLVLLAYIFPRLLKPVHKLWMSMGIIMGAGVTFIILSVLLYLLITPISFLARWMGKDFLDIKMSRDSKSYWISKEDREFKKESYEKQF